MTLCGALFSVARFIKDFHDVVRIARTDGTIGYIDFFAGVNGKKHHL